MKTLIITLLLGLSLNAQAFEKEDTSLSFRDALLESNKDYNQHKKNVLDQENDRIENWGQRKTVSLTVQVGIDVEDKDYKPMQQDHDQETISNLEHKAKKLEVIHEVSMN